jgi:hypothetical protein
MCLRGNPETSFERSALKSSIARGPSHSALCMLHPRSVFAHRFSSSDRLTYGPYDIKIYPLVPPPRVPVLVIRNESLSNIPPAPRTLSPSSLRPPIISPLNSAITNPDRKLDCAQERVTSHVGESAVEHVRAERGNIFDEQVLVRLDGGSNLLCADMARPSSYIRVE